MPTLDWIGRQAVENHHKEVPFHLLRVDPVRSDQAFWLPTLTGRFYPDFLCRLHSHRRLVVEYKGADRWGNPEETAKRHIGQ